VKLSRNRSSRYGKDTSTARAGRSTTSRSTLSGTNVSTALTAMTSPSEPKVAASQRLASSPLRRHRSSAQTAMSTNPA
jgi:hypothetical protein